MGKENIHKSCYLCGSEKINALKGYENHSLIKCKQCDFVFMQKIPTSEELDKHYGTYAYGGDTYLSPITIKSYNKLLDTFEKYRKSNKILDVGCGRGFFLLEAKKRGWDVYGTEYSPTAVKKCIAAGIKMKEGVLDLSDFEVGSFDIITSFEVLEHINTPVEEVAKFYSLLRKKGLFYCTTPNFNALQRYQLKEKFNVINYPEHLSYFTRKTLLKLCKDVGFTVKGFKSTGISITRHKTSTGQSQEKFIAEDSADEKLRKKIEGKWYLGIIKKVVNQLLTLTNKGITLKGFFIKK